MKTFLVFTYKRTDKLRKPLILRAKLHAEHEDHAQQIACVVPGFIDPITQLESGIVYDSKYVEQQHILYEVADQVIDLRVTQEVITNMHIAMDKTLRSIA